MLKKSLFTAVLLGALVAVAAAQSDENTEVEKAQRFQEPQPELVLEDLAEPGAACAADAVADELKSVDFATVLQQQSSSQLEDLGFRPRYCYWTRFGIWCF